MSATKAVLTCLQLAVICSCALQSFGWDDPPFEVIKKKLTEYALPKLAYEYNGLEPYLDEATLVAHHTGHHAAYTKKMNVALAQWRKEIPHDDFAKESILEILQDLERVPEQFKTAVTNNGGGYVNHALYWTCMSPSGQERRPSGTLATDIDAVFGNYSAFKDQFTNAAISLFGSGYVWLVRDPDVPASDASSLEIISSANQDSPISDGLHPILVLDVWEHAYYLKHQFRRADHIKDWWNVVDWDSVYSLDMWWKNLNSEHDEL